MNLVEQASACCFCRDRFPACPAEQNSANARFSLYNLRNQPARFQSATAREQDNRVPSRDRNGGGFQWRSPWPCGPPKVIKNRGPFLRTTLEPSRDPEGAVFNRAV